MRHLSEAFFERLVPGGSITIVSSTAGFGWPERLEAIRDVLATDTFEEGAAWFKANPQQGNAYNFSKEVSTVYTQSMGLALAQMGLRINAVLPGPVETPILVDFEESMGKDTWTGSRNSSVGTQTPRRYRLGGALPGLRRRAVGERAGPGGRRRPHRRRQHRRGPEAGILRPR